VAIPTVNNNAHTNINFFMTEEFISIFLFVFQAALFFNSFYTIYDAPFSEMLQPGG
jgi:hypothetical protein